MHNSNLLWELGVLLLGAKIVAEVVERWLKQPAVLGELVLGILLGGSALKVVDPHSDVVKALAEIGAVLLLFEVGLESDLKDLFRVGGQAMSVAVIGVVLPMVLGTAVCRMLNMPWMESIFVGSALTATSVGITARVFGDLGCLKFREAHIVLGAAVIDDVLGLIVLAVVSGLASSASFSVLGITLQSLLSIVFLVGGIWAGRLVAPRLMAAAGKMQTRAALSIFALVICFGFAYAAQVVKLAPIVGGFAAGLVLNSVEERINFEEKIKNTADFFIPIFFVLMGAQIDLGTLNPFTPAGQETLAIGAALTAVAIVGKVAAGFLMPAGDKVNRWIIGLGMIPRGEVGLIFAGIGLSAKIIPPSLYAAVVFLVIVTTFLTPLLLKGAVKGIKLPEGQGLPQPAESGATAG